ncbi:unnamed protein product [Choristocarpus tenellus]
MSTSSKSHTRTGEQAWNKISKVNAELFTLTYGAMVMQLIQDFEDVNAINKQLETMGYNMGVRLIDEFLAKSNVHSPGGCSDLKETADIIAKAREGEIDTCEIPNNTTKVAFKMFLGVSADVASWNAEANAFSLLLYDNPLIEFVELPPQYGDLLYSNLLCGVIRGALEMVQMKVECRFVRDVLRGDDVNEIRVELKQLMDDVMDEDYKEA